MITNSKQDKSVVGGYIHSILSLFKKFTTQAIIEMEKCNSDLKGRTLAKKKWQYSLIGPLQHIIRQTNQKFKQICSTEFSDAKTTIFQICGEIEDSLKDLLNRNAQIDQSLSLRKLHTIYFPKNSNCEIYVGQIDTGKRSGDLRNGEGSWTNGQAFYKGNWFEGKRHGFGIQVYQDGSNYKGIWKNNEPSCGTWTLPDKTKFYGRIHRGRGSGSSYLKDPRSWLLGLKESDEIKHPHKINFLYYKNKLTPLSNLKFDQNFDIQALKGGPKPTKIEFANGIEYEGMFKNFIPNLMGKLRIPTDKHETGMLELNTLSRFGKMLVVKRFEPSDLGAIRKRKRAKITFLNGIYYEGGVDDHLRFTGFGYFGTKRVGKYSLFDPAQGILFNFVDDEENLDILRQLDRDYFLDSEAYIAKHGDELQFSTTPWLKLIGIYRGIYKNKVIEYRGGWENNHPAEGICKIKVDGKVKDLLLSNGIYYTTKNIQLNDLLKGDKKNRYKELTLNFLDGSKYEGTYDSQTYNAEGIGTYTYPDGSRKRGYWERSCLIFDVSLVDDSYADFDLTKLKSGRQRVKYKNGVIYDGDWKDYRWDKSGKGTIQMTIGKGKKKIVPWNWRENKQYLNRSSKMKNLVVDLRPMYDFFSELIGGSGNLENLNREIWKTQSHPQIDVKGILRGNGFIVDSDKKEMKLTCSVKAKKGKLYFEELTIMKATTIAHFLAKEKYEKKQMHTSFLLNPNKLYIYDEFDFNFSGECIDIHDLSSRAIFQETDYQHARKPIKIGSQQKTEEEAKLKHQSRSKFSQTKKDPYIQITKRGLLKSIIPLFRLEPPFDKKLTEKMFAFNPNILIAKYEMNKLNGIFKAEFDRIKFFNGDKYEFENSERNYMNSLGSFMKYRANDHMHFGHYYWKSFMNESLISHFDDDFFKNELKGRMKVVDLMNVNQVLLKFNNGNVFQNYWFYKESLGVGFLTYLNEDQDKETINSFWHKYSVMQKNNGIGVVSRALQNLGETLSIFPQGLISEVELLFFFRSIYERVEPIDSLIKKRGNSQKFTLNEIKFDKILQNDFKITIQDKNYSTLKELFFYYRSLTKSAQDQKNKANLQQKPSISRNQKLKVYNVQVSYTNGDHYTGEKVWKRGCHGNGTYEWSSGYSYKGEFFLNTPFGQGRMTNCLGVRREGYFFKGFLLKKDYGLEKLKKFIEKDYLVKRDNLMEKDDLDLLTDPDLMKGCAMFLQFPLSFTSILNGIYSSKKKLQHDLECIKDGELDYDYDWGAKASQFVRVSKMIEECQKIEVTNKFGDAGENRKKVRQGGAGGARSPNKPSLKLQNLTRDVMKDVEVKKSRKIIEQMKKKQEKEQAIEHAKAKKKEKTQILRSKAQFDIKIHAVSSEQDTPRTKLRKKKSKGIFSMNKLDSSPKNLGDIKEEMLLRDELDAFIIEQIIELVKDKNTQGIRNIYVKYKNQKKVFKFLCLNDNLNRNLLMITAFFGYRQVFIDMLCALRRCIAIERVSIDQIKQYLSQRDIEGNNIVDLACIQGFNIDDDFIYAHKEQLFLEDLRRKESPGKMNGIGAKTAKSDDLNFRKDNSVYVNNWHKIALDQMNCDLRDLFTEDLLNFESLFDTLTKIDLGGSKSSDLFFISRRAFCLSLLFSFCKHYSFHDLIRKSDYYLKANNPMHFALYKGDFHATLALLKYKPQIMLWRNHDKEMPPQAIKWSGLNKHRSKAIFGSILREFTRLFNIDTIMKLFVSADGILYQQKQKVSRKGVPQPDKWDRERVRLIKQALNENYEFDFENVLLYHSDYITLSDELCKQYLNLLRDRSRFKLLKEEMRIMKNYVFEETSELQALQRNFLDFYKGKFKGYHDPFVERDMIESVKNILCWYVYIFGEAEIEPEIYKILEIDPFETVLDGKNIFHFMCENNSPLLLKKVLDDLYSQCHTRPFDDTRQKYEEWDSQRLDPEKLNRLKKSLNIGTKEWQNTPAHLCIFHGNLECLDNLLKYKINMEVANFRGRTIKELLSYLNPFNVSSENIMTVQKMCNQLIEYIKADFLTTCKQHSLTYEFIQDSEDEKMSNIIHGSHFALNSELTEVRDQLIERIKNYLKDFNDKSKEISYFKNFLELATKLEKMEKNKINKEISVLQKLYLESEDQQVQFKGYLLEKSHIYHLICIFKGDNTIFFPMETKMKALFTTELLTKMSNFKYTKYEKFMKMDFLEKLEQADFSKPLDPNLKNVFKMDQLFCIEIQMEKDGEIEEHIVVDQVNNIRKKFIKYGGGLKIELMKGFEVQKTNKMMMDAKTVDTWYILITIADKLLKKISQENQMMAYNMIENYHTNFSENSLDEENLEPLRHYQKINIMMKLLKEEFEIESYHKKGLVVKYFPVHNYLERYMIDILWNKNKWQIHFFDIFQNSSEKSLQVMSLITFYHGIQQGFYFGFLSMYTNIMFYMAVVGVIGWFMTFALGVDMGVITSGGSMLAGIWSSLVVNLWKRRQKELAFCFDALDEDTKKDVRQEYKGKAIISEETLEITKQYKSYYWKKLFFTLGLFMVGCCCSTTVVWLVVKLNNHIHASEKSDLEKTGLSFLVGAMNGTINFMLSVIYGKAVEYLVEWENHAYDEDLRNSIILKKVSFRLFSTVFTNVVQSIFYCHSYKFYTTQVLSNLITSAFLNYGLSVGLPFFQYMVKRYDLSYVIKCEFCSKKQKEGKIEMFKKDIIVDMLADEKTWETFRRYCLDNKTLQDLPKDLQKLVKEREKKNFENKTAQRMAQKPGKTRSRRRNHRTHLHVIGKHPKNKLEEIEKVKPHSDYLGKHQDLGINRPKNIKYRLKEEFAKYVLGREKIIESSYMLDLGSLEEGMHISLLTQYTFVCFFSPFLITAGLVSYLINLIIIYLTVFIYVKITRRPVSRRVSSIGIWNHLYITVGYLGIIYNAIIIVKMNGSLFKIKPEYLRHESRRSEGCSAMESNKNDDYIFEVETIYRVQIYLLLFKVALGMLISKKVPWIEKLRLREKMTKERLRKRTAKILSKIGMEKSKRKDGKFDKSIFEDSEAKSLKYFFKKVSKIKNYDLTKEEGIFGHFENPKLKVLNIRKDLM